MIVDDSFSRLTTRMLLHDSFSDMLPPSSVRREKYILLPVCLTERHLVFTFLRRRKSLELAALVILLARLPVNYHQLSRTSLTV